MLNKRGQLTTDEFLGTIPAIVIVVLLFVFLGNLISSNFDKDEKTAESYFDNFKEQIAVADSGGIGSFRMWHLENDDEGNFYLVYFGSSSSYENKLKFDSLGNNLKFYSLGNNLNHICLCYLENEDSKCSYCEKLEYPVSVVGLSVDEYDCWAIDRGKKIEIIRGDGVYEIKEV